MQVTLYLRSKRGWLSQRLPNCLGNLGDHPGFGILSTIGTHLTCEPSLCTGAQGTKAHTKYIK